MNRVRIFLNGAAKEIAAATTVLALLEEAGINRRTCAVEINREVIPKSRHGERVLHAEDRVEIVTMVGGG